MAEALYPPYAVPAPVRFSLRRALFEMAQNPLRILPASIYREPIVQGRDLGIGRMRDERLNESLYHGLSHARAEIAAWIANYNTERPRSAPVYRTPAA